MIGFGKRLNADPLGLITRLWPKLELREDELPQSEALPTPAEPEYRWGPPLPASIEAVIGIDRDDVFRLTDEQWERIQPVLPEQRTRQGDPRDRRGLVEGALWKEQTGAPWGHLPADYGPYQTVSHNYRKWRRSGVWEAILGTLNAAPQAPPAAA